MTAKTASPSRHSSEPRISTDNEASSQDGLRRHLIDVYRLVAAGLATTGLVAWVSAATGLYAALAVSGLLLIPLLVPFAIVLFLAHRLGRTSIPAAHALYFLLTACFGLALGGIFSVYTGSSITLAFLTTAGVFVALSTYGQSTGRDLSAMGSFMMAGLFGVIIAGVANLVMHSGALEFALSICTIVVFLGMTAWDAQAIRRDYAGNPDVDRRSAVMGALNLYLDALNLFLQILQFLGAIDD